MIEVTLVDMSDAVVETEKNESVQIFTEENESVEITVKNTESTEFSVDGVVYPCRCTGDYNDLKNKPSINGKNIEGDQSSEYYGLQGKLTFCTNLDIDSLFKKEQK